MPPENPIAVYIDSYRRTNDVGQLLDDLRSFASGLSAADAKAAAEPFRDLPEVVIPLYEHVTAVSPTDAQALVVLANSYWLAGRGPEAVSKLATRAKEIDPSNRGAWHLWALAEPSLRGRVERWLEVSRRFPADQLARAALADNATSLANDDEDPVALKIAIDTYEGLLAESTQTAQRLALEETLKTLRNWRF
jgi:hypothetical protein